MHILLRLSANYQINPTETKLIFYSVVLCLNSFINGSNLLVVSGSNKCKNYPINNSRIWKPILT